MNDTKYCCGCGEEKPASEFSPHNLTADGLRRDCRDCSGYRGAQVRPRETAQRTVEALYWQMQADRMTAKHIRRLEAMA